MLDFLLAVGFEYSSFMFADTFYPFSIEKEYVMPWVIHLYHSLYLECHWIIFFFIGMHINVISLGKYNLYVIFSNERCLQSACKYNFDVDTPLAKDLSCHFNLNFFLPQGKHFDKTFSKSRRWLKTSLMMWE